MAQSVIYVRDKKTQPWHIILTNGMHPVTLTRQRPTACGLRPTKTRIGWESYRSDTDGGRVCLNCQRMLVESIQEC